MTNFTRILKRAQNMKSTAHKFQLAKRAASTLNIINNKKIPPNIKKCPPNSLISIIIDTKLRISFNTNTIIYKFLICEQI